MPDLKEPVALTSHAPVMGMDALFRAFGDPMRRRMLAQLARGGAQIAAALHPRRYRHQIDNIVRHLTRMRKEGVVIMSDNPVDGRRALYALSPAIRTALSESGVLFHFSSPEYTVSIQPSSDSAKGWSEDAVFTTLADPVRRNLLVALARGGPRTVFDLVGASGRDTDGTLKRLVILRRSGLVTMGENPKDRRRALYALSPNVPLTVTELGKVIDLGFCVLRLG